jgi:hypothetical protein
VEAQIRCYNRVSRKAREIPSACGVPIVGMVLGRFNRLVVDIVDRDES